MSLHQRCPLCGSLAPNLTERVFIQTGQKVVLCDNCWVRGELQSYGEPRVLNPGEPFSRYLPPPPLYEEPEPPTPWCRLCGEPRPENYRLVYCREHKPERKEKERRKVIVRRNLDDPIERKDPEVERRELQDEHLGVFSLPVALIREDRTALNNGRNLSCFEPRLDTVTKIQRRETKTLGRISILEAWSNDDDEEP